MTSRSTDDLARIANVGGGLDFDGSNVSTDGLARIVNVAKPGATIIIRGMASRSTDDLARIANVGKGRVILVLD